MWWLLAVISAINLGEHVNKMVESTLFCLNSAADNYSGEYESILKDFSASKLLHKHMCVILLGGASYCSCGSKLF